MSGRLSTQTINLSPPPQPRTQDESYMGWEDFPPIGPDIADDNRIFIPPTSTSKPSDLYNVCLNQCNIIPGYRFVRSKDPSEMFMFVDGSCLDNGSVTARAGFGVVFALIFLAHGSCSTMGFPIAVDMNIEQSSGVHT